MKLAVWSGPRNLSTAMLYAFANRGDTTPWDEPFYAPYLAATGLEHPMKAEILAAHETDPARVAKAVGQGGRPHVYLKVMPHHMLPDFPTDWAADFTHVHLIRHPARVIASYTAKRENPTLEDLGYPQQTALYRRFPGPVVDSADIRADPGGVLATLCDAVGLAFSDAMLRWPAGPRDFDGAWAPHWYGGVHRSTGFEGAEGPLPRLDPGGERLMQAALPHYNALAARRLT